MKTYETQTVKVERSVMTELKCDLCGVVAEDGEWETDQDWGIEETEIRYRSGVIYPENEGGNGTEINIDICPNCFKNKLIPWVISIGGGVREEHWNY